MCSKKEKGGQVTKRLTKIQETTKVKYQKTNQKATENKSKSKSEEQRQEQGTDRWGKRQSQEVKHDIKREIAVNPNHDIARSDHIWTRQIFC